MSRRSLASWFLVTACTAGARAQPAPGDWLLTDALVGGLFHTSPGGGGLTTIAVQGCRPSSTGWRWPPTTPISRSRSWPT